MRDPTTCDWRALVAELNGLLRLRTTVIGMKLFERFVIVCFWLFFVFVIFKLMTKG